jgi:hypothetical protein
MRVSMSNHTGISCRFMSPTDSKGIRIKVFKSGDVHTFNIEHWDYELGTAENYEQAAKNFATNMGWGGTMVGAFVETGAVFIFTHFKDMLNATK